MDRREGLGVPASSGGRAAAADAVEPVPVSSKADIPNAGRRLISVSEFHKELAAQGVGHRDYAFKCVSCGTVQSMNSMVAAGVPADKVDRYIAFSCEGRWNSARGCDWTLGGLFTIHTLEVVTEDGERHPRFEPASPEEAQSLASAIEARSGETVQQGSTEGESAAQSEATGDAHTTPGDPQ